MISLIFSLIPQRRTIFHVIPWYSIPFDIPLDPTTFHDISWCSMIFHRVPWCSMMFHAVCNMLQYSMYDIPLCPALCDDMARHSMHKIYDLPRYAMILWVESVRFQELPGYCVYTRMFTCVTMLYAISRYSTRFHDILWYSIVLWWDYMIFYDKQRCSTIFNDFQWYSLISHDVPWYAMIFHNMQW